MRPLFTGIGAATLLALAAYLYVQRPHPQTPEAAAVAFATTTVISINPSGTPVTADVIEDRSPAPDGFVPYRNEQYGILFYHRPEATVRVYDEGGGAATIVLENLADPERARGFQVFIVPYADAKITEERFRKDVSSGVRTDVENTTLDGVPAVTFRSYDIFLGQTREIWAIRNGYLYEITSLSGTGNWFTPIIQSWEFI